MSWVAPLIVAQAESVARSWDLALRAERKSPQTLKTYGDGVRFYLRGAPRPTCRR